MILYQSTKFTKYRKMVYFRTLLVTTTSISKKLFEYLFKKISSFFESLMNIDKSSSLKFLYLISIICITIFLLKDYSLLFLLLSPTGPIIFTNIILYSGFLTLAISLIIIMKYIVYFINDIISNLLYLLFATLIILLFGLFLLLFKNSEKIIKQNKIDKKIAEFQTFNPIDCMQFIMK